ncbi:hypothetical protein ACFSUK_29130 [Sphingobium scionense]
MVAATAALTSIVGTAGGADAISSTRALSMTIFASPTSRTTPARPVSPI